MKRILAAGTAMLLAMGAASAAQAAVITIDDFQTTASLTDNTVGNGAASSSGLITVDGRTFMRSIFVDQIENPDPSNPMQRSSLNIGSGHLYLNNDAESNAVFSLEYNIDSLLPEFGGTSDLMLTIDGFDATFDVPMTIRVELGDYSTSQTFTGAISPNDPNVDALFNLPELKEGDTLRISFFAGTSSDMNFLPIRIDIGTGGELPVPEPGALGLLGLGLASVAFARRRKVAA